MAIGRVYSRIKSSSFRTRSKEDEFMLVVEEKFREVSCESGGDEAFPPVVAEY